MLKMNPGEIVTVCTKHLKSGWFGVFSRNGQPIDKINIGEIAIIVGRNFENSNFNHNANSYVYVLTPRNKLGWISIHIIKSL